MVTTGTNITTAPATRTIRRTWSGAPNPQYIEPIPDSSIKNIKPTITPAFTLPPDIAATKPEKYVRKNYPDTFRHCCVCGARPTKKASYPVQGAVVIQYYCDKCADKELRY